MFSAWRAVKKFFLFLFTGILFVFGVPDIAQVERLEEYAVKAAFIYNFTKFIQWPETAFENSESPYLISVFGDDQVKTHFQTLDGKKSSERAIQIRYYPDAASLKSQTGTGETGFLKSNVVFIGEQVGPDETLRILSLIADHPVLTIGEIRNFTKMGGIIQFFSRNDHLHFEINIKSGEQHALKFSSRLLKLAVVVDEGQ